MERIAVELHSIFGQGIVGDAARRLHETALDSEIFGKPFDARLLRAFDKLPVGDPLAAFALIFSEWPAVSLREWALRFRWSENAIREVERTLEAIRRLESGDHSGVPVLAFDAGREASERAVFSAGHRKACSRLQASTRHRFESGDFFDDLVSLRGGSTGDCPAATGAGGGTFKRRLLEGQLRGEIASRDDAVAALKEWTVEKPN